MSSSAAATQSEPRRRLVTVRRIDKITPIKNSRRNVLTVGGWNVVVRRAENFYQHQLVVFFEIDSFLPNNSKFWEYVSSCPTTLQGGPPGFLVKTTMIDRNLSQGLVFHISSFPEVIAELNKLECKYKGDENAAVQELMSMSFEDVLGVKKWDYPEVTEGSLITGERSHPKPVFFPRAGCERAQNLLYLFEDHYLHHFQITEKLDGLSMSVYLVQESSQWYSGISYLPPGHTQRVGAAHIGIASRSKSIPANEASTSWFWKTASQQGILNKIAEAGKNIAVQGELCGSSILTNSMGFPEGEHHFYVFDIFDIDKQMYLPFHKARKMCRDFDWDYVPVIEHNVRLGEFAHDLEDLIRKADGLGMRGRKREGLVFKAVYRDYCFKVISNEWLMETGHH
ncbi:RNA ligase-domain-containing protein [Biscogniauxia mediterranea]|nr:RNA ligase-domain-containing protein [Biscogniauxia mediterranea]